MQLIIIKTKTNYTLTLNIHLVKNIDTVQTEIRKSLLCCFYFKILQSSHGKLFYSLYQYFYNNKNVIQQCLKIPNYL